MIEPVRQAPLLGRELAHRTRQILERRCGLGGRPSRGGAPGRLLRVVDLMAQALDEHAGLGELALALDQIALRRALELAAALELTLEVLHLLFELDRALAQPGLLARRSGHGGWRFGRALSVPQQPLERRARFVALRVVGAREEIKMQAELPVAAQAGLVGHAPRALVGLDPAPLRACRARLLVEDAEDGETGRVVGERLVREVREQPGAALRLGAHPGVAQATCVRELDEPSGVEELVERPGDTPGAEVLQDLLVALAHRPMPSEVSRYSATCDE